MPPSRLAMLWDVTEKNRDDAETLSRIGETVGLLAEGYWRPREKVDAGEETVDVDGLRQADQMLSRQPVHLKGTHTLSMSP